MATPAKISTYSIMVCPLLSDLRHSVIFVYMSVTKISMLFLWP
jgi:hypothetical protein